jgi:hypothetical protein
MLWRGGIISAVMAGVCVLILCYDEVDGKHVREFQFQYEACTSMGRMFSSSFACRCTARNILAHFTSHKSLPFESRVQARASENATSPVNR